MFGIFKNIFKEDEHGQKELFDLLPQIVFEMDLKGNFIFVNKYGFEISGYSQEDLERGINIFKLFDTKDQNKLKKNMQRLLSGEKLSGTEYTVLKKDGRVFPALVYSNLIIRKKKPVGLRGVAINIAERKKAELALKDSEERYRTLVNNVNIGIYRNTGGSEGRFLQANPAIAKLFGYSSVKEFMKIAVADLYQTPQDRQAFIGDILKHGFVKDKELALRKKDGTPIWGSCTAKIKFDNKGKIKWMDGVIEDITERRKIDQAKTEFISLASHQFRTPLTDINWSAEALLEGEAGKLTKKQKEYITNLHDSGKRLVDLINALLNVSRIELGVLAVEPEPTDLVKIANSVLGELKSGIKSKKLKVKKKYDQGLPIINADPSFIRIIFQNLLSNAVKYTPPSGEINLEIALHKQEALITVKDTGYGIPQEEQSKMFTKFFRAKNIKQKEEEGTGLGLYIIKSILEQTGGKIRFESAEGKGTIFYVSVPLKGMKEKQGTRGLTYKQV